MKSKLSGSLLLAGILLSGGILTSNGASAAGIAEYSLDPMVITATMTEKKDMEVPSTTSVYSHKQLVQTGATTVEGALKYATGLVFKAETAGTGEGEFLVRGKRRGTLVLVNGVPENVRTGYYDLDSINIDDVERIEIIRGGGAILYGSDSTGGVINIITKDQRSNMLSVSGGNYGVQNYRGSMQAGKLGISGSWNKKGAIDHTSEGSKYFNFKRGEKTVLSGTYSFDDNWTLSADYNNHDLVKEYLYSSNNKLYNKRFVSSEKSKFVLNYNKDGWKGNVFYHDSSSDTRNHNENQKKDYIKNAYFYGHEDQIFGLDLSKEIQDGKNTWILGGKFYNEGYEYYKYNNPLYSKDPLLAYDYDRNVYSVFAQLDHSFDDKNNIILGARETWTGSTPDGTNYDEFTPQAQYLYKIQDDLNFYASVGKSFTLPTLTDMYGKDQIILNTSIKPEVGMHYETGLKHISGNHSWKLAIFKSDVENFITNYENKKTGESYAVNEDTKNIGIELSSEVFSDNGFSANWGISYSNPKYRSTKEDDGVWKRNYGRWLLNGGVNYQQDKFSIGLNGSFMADRVLQKYQEEVKPYFYTSLHATYKPEKDHEIFLNIDNLLDRNDITSHVSSRYLAQGTNFELGYKLSF